MRSSATSEGDRHCEIRLDGEWTVKLRSSATSEGDRHSLVRAINAPGVLLRSSATSEGDRHMRAWGVSAPRHWVAILGHLGGRPPHQPAGSTRADARCDPRPPRRATATVAHRPASRLSRSCDPRPPRRATATRRAARRSWTRCGCDPRPPRRATATPDDLECLAGCPVAILGHLGGRPPRVGPFLPRRGWQVAILGHLGGRPPLCVLGVCAGRSGGCDPRPPRRATATRQPVNAAPDETGLRSSATSEGDRHHGH